MYVFTFYLGVSIFCKYLLNQRRGKLAELILDALKALVCFLDQQIDLILNDIYSFGVFIRELWTTISANFYDVLFQLLIRNEHFAIVLMNLFSSLVLAQPLTEKRNGLTFRMYAHFD